MNYCVCSFMEKLVLIGGKDKWGEYNKACMFYDKHNDKWTYIADMMEGRANAACTVFEGKVVVCGGRREETLIDEAFSGIHLPMYSVHTLRSVEAYDYYENKWSSFPSMLISRKNHTAVSISNKMFMIGGKPNKWEVFESVTRMFTSVKSPLLWNNSLHPFHAVCIGYKIYIFQGEKASLLGDKYYDVKVHSYDVVQNDFAFKTSFYLENIKSCCFTKLPMF